MPVKQRHPRAGRSDARGLTWMLVCAAVILSLVAMGCGDDADSGDTGSQPTIESTADAAETDAATEDAATTTEGATEAAVAGECEGAAELEGEDLEIAIPFPPGGGFDRHARLIGDALAEDFGITPVPVNEVGAGGLLTLNQHVTTDPEELRIQYVQTPSAVAAQIAGAEGASFSLEEWPWLARVTVDPQLAVASTTSGFESLEDAFGGEEQARIGALGPGGIDYLHGQVLPVTLGSEAELVTGFASPAEAILSVTSGDIDMYVLDERALLPAVKAGDVVPLAHIGREASPNLPEVPVVTDLVEDGTEEADLLDDYLNLIEIGRAFAAVPGADEARVETLRCMLETVLTNPEVVALIEQEGDKMAYAPGPEMQESIAQALQAGDRFVALLEESF